MLAHRRQKPQTTTHDKNLVAKKPAQKKFKKVVKFDYSNDNLQSLNNRIKVIRAMKKPSAQDQKDLNYFQFLAAMRPETEKPKAVQTEPRTEEGWNALEQRVLYLEAIVKPTQKDMKELAHLQTISMKRPDVHPGYRIMGVAPAAAVAPRAPRAPSRAPASETVLKKEPKPLAKPSPKRSKIPSLAAALDLELDDVKPADVEPKKKPKGESRSEIDAGEVFSAKYKSLHPDRAKKNKRQVPEVHVPNDMKRAQGKKNGLDEEDRLILNINYYRSVGKEKEAKNAIKALNKLQPEDKYALDKEEEIDQSPPEDEETARGSQSDDEGSVIETPNAKLAGKLIEQKQALMNQIYTTEDPEGNRKRMGKILEINKQLSKVLGYDPGLTDEHSSRPETPFPSSPSSLNLPPSPPHGPPPYTILKDGSVDLTREEVEYMKSGRGTRTEKVDALLADGFKPSKRDDAMGLYAFKPKAPLAPAKQTLSESLDKIKDSTESPSISGKGFMNAPDGPRAKYFKEQEDYRRSLDNRVKRMVISAQSQMLAEPRTSGFAQRAVPLDLSHQQRVAQMIAESIKLPEASEVPLAEGGCQANCGRKRRQK